MAAPRAAGLRQINSASRMPPIGISAVILLSAFILFFSVAPMRGLFWLHPGDFPA